MKSLSDDLAFPEEQFGKDIDKKMIKICKKHWKHASSLEEFFDLCEKDLKKRKLFQEDPNLQCEDC